MPQLILVVLGKVMLYCKNLKSKQTKKDAEAVTVLKTQEFVSLFRTVLKQQSSSASGT